MIAKQVIAKQVIAKQVRRVCQGLGRDEANVSNICEKYAKSLSGIYEVFAKDL